MNAARLVAGAASVAAVAVVAFIVYAGRDSADVDFEHGYEASFVEDFHPRERAGDTYFRWTRAVSYVVFRNLPRGGRMEVSARIRTIRPGGQELPDLNFSANGVTVHRERAAAGEHEYAFAFPGMSGPLRLGIESQTFEAGGGRHLGVQVLEVEVRNPSGSSAAMVPAMWIGAATMALYIAALLAGMSVAAAAASAVGAGATLCLLVSRGPVLFTAYPVHVALLAAGVLVTVLLAKTLAASVGWPLGRDCRAMLAVLGLTLLVKGAALSFPLWLSSDAEFQANRFDQFLAGDWHPTSVTQHEPPFRIPYPVSLYAVAAPLRAVGLTRVPALETATVVFDVLAGIVVLLLGMRYFGRRAGIIAALVFHASPVSPLAFSAGNFTNVFALSVLTIGFGLLVTSDTDGRWRSVVGAAVFALLALTAHFGMLLEGSLLWVAWLACVILLVPRPQTSDRRAALVGAVAVSFALAAVYYLGYWELVANQSQRALGGGSGAAGDGVAAKLSASLGIVREQIGLVTVLAAVAGAVTALRGRWFDTAFHAGLVVWLAATAAFLLVDLVTPLQIRYWYQSLPAVALLAGAYLSAAFDRGGLGRFAGGAAVLYIAANGLWVLYGSMMYRYH